MTEANNDKPAPAPRSLFRHFETIATRWMDNDAYGHVNNVVYYIMSMSTATRAARWRCPRHSTTPCKDCCDRHA